MGAGVHAGHQHEAGLILRLVLHPGDGHYAVLQRLAQGLQRGTAELGQLIQKQHAVVGHGYLAGPGVGAAPDERGDRS